MEKQAEAKPGTQTGGTVITPGTFRLEYLVREKQGASVKVMQVDNHGTLSVQDVEHPLCPRDPDGKVVEWTSDGTCMAVLGNTGVRVWQLPADSSVSSNGTASLLGQISRPNIVAMALSPRGSYLLTFERPPTGATTPAPNLLVWDLRQMRTGAQEPVVLTAPTTGLFSKQYSRDLWPTLCWSADESLCARVVSNEVHFLPGDAKALAALVSADGTSAKASAVFKAENAIKAKWAPCLVHGEARIAIAQAAKKGVPGYVRIVCVTPGTEPVQLSQKAFQRADQLELLWSSSGTHVLILASSDDTSGKLYDRDTKLLLVSAPVHRGKQARDEDTGEVEIRKEGPIHDVAWSPDGQRFAAIYGYMPEARVSLFKRSGALSADLTSGPFNHCRWAPNGRLLAIHGSGSVRADMQVWEPFHLKKLSSFACDATAFSWLPSSLHIASVIAFPKLKVDNRYQVWRFDGTPMLLTKIPDELYEVSFLPSAYPVGTFPLVSQLPATLPPPQNIPLIPTKPKAAVYRHPNAKADAPALIKKVEEGPRKYKPAAQPRAVPAVSDETLPPGYAPVEKPKPKPKPKQKKEPEAAAPAVEISVEDIDPEKKIRNLEKKLRQIKLLKEKQESGFELSDQELQKVSQETAVVSQIASLSKLTKS